MIGVLILVQVLAMIVLIICLPFVILPLLVLGLQLLLNKTFWIIIGLILLGFIIYMIVEKKTRGFLKEATGYISFEGVNPSQFSTLRLYPDKITINDIQIIPIERVKKATFNTHTKTVGGYKNYVQRHTYYLTVTFKNKDGKIDSVICRSKENQASAHIDYIRMEKKINKHISYTEPPKTKYPNKPYEL